MLFAGLAAVSAADEDNVNKLATNTDIQQGTNSPDSPHELAPTTPDRPPDSDKAASLAFNQAVIHALAAQLASTHPQHCLADIQELILAADSFPHARHLLMLALLQACHLTAKPAGVAASILKVVSAKWSEVQESGASTGPTPAAVVDEGGVPTAAHFRHWQRRAGKSHAAVLQQALLAGLRAASSQQLQLLHAQMVCTSLYAAGSFLCAHVFMRPGFMLLPQSCADLWHGAQSLCFAEYRVATFPTLHVNLSFTIASMCCLCWLVSVCLLAYAALVRAPLTLGTPCPCRLVIDGLGHHFCDVPGCDVVTRACLCRRRGPF